MKQEPETCSYFRTIYEEFKKLKGEREKAAVELFKKRGMEGKHKEIFKERIERDEKGMTFYFEETKKIKNLVQFTRLENNRHNHEVEFIGKHLVTVATTIRSKVTAHAEDACLTTGNMITIVLTVAGSVLFIVSTRLSLICFIYP